jgi:hypothetical protein
MSESLLFSLLSGGGGGGRDEVVEDLHLELAEREQGLRAEISRISQQQRALLRQCSRLQTQLEREVARERELSAEQIAEEIAAKRVEADQLKNSRKTLRQALRSVQYARSNVCTNAQVKAIIQTVNHTNAVMGVRESAHMLPAAMRAGQTLKTVSDQYRDASSELHDALEHSDDEDEREAEASAVQTMNDAPSAVHVSTNPRLILKYAQEKHSLTTRERLSRASATRGRPLYASAGDVQQRSAARDDHDTDLFSVF